MIFQARPRGRRYHGAYDVTNNQGWVSVGINHDTAEFAVATIESWWQSVARQLSKWNKIEHRLFSFISINWRGRPLTSYQVVLSLIAATATKTGLSVKSVLDEKTYQKGIEVPWFQIGK